MAFSRLILSSLFVLIPTHLLFLKTSQKDETLKFCVFNSAPLIKTFILHLSFSLISELYQSVKIVPPKGSAELKRHKT